MDSGAQPETELSSQGAATKGRPLRAALMAGLSATAVTYEWLRYTAPPKETLYAGALLLFLSPILWLGSFVVFWPWWHVLFKPAGKRLTLDHGLMFGACALVGATIASLNIEIAYQKWRESRAHAWSPPATPEPPSDYDRVKAELANGVRLSAYRRHLTPGTRRALVEALWTTKSAAQVHEVVVTYPDDAVLLNTAAIKPITSADDLRAIFLLYPDLAAGENEKVFLNLATNPNTPTDILRKLATSPQALVADASETALRQRKAKVP